MAHFTAAFYKAPKKRVRAPSALEAGLCLSLAERYRLASDVQQARALVTSVVENHPGRVPLHELEQNFDPAQEINWMNTVRPQRADEDGEDPMAGTGAHDTKWETSIEFDRTTINNT